jgi:hypothetical protein
MPIYSTASNAIVHEFLDDEVIIANLKTGCYFSVRGSGIPIWQLLIAGVDSGALPARLASHYGDLPTRCMSEIQAFINSVSADGLLVTVDDTTQDADAALDIHFPSAYLTPVIEKYDEMTDLLMLDPVHEVDEQGWPKRPEAS